MRLGIISDTHGRLDSLVLEIFQGVDRILHAGDVGGREILDELQGLAPVTTVLGNTDGFPLASSLKQTEILQLEGESIALTHRIGSPAALSDDAMRIVQAHRPTMVVFGHTHAPFDRLVGGVRYVNPGAAGPRRFSLPRTVAVMEIAAGKPTRVRLVPLDKASEAMLSGGSW